VLLEETYSNIVKGMKVVSYLMFARCEVVKGPPLEESSDSVGGRH